MKKNAQTEEKKNIKNNPFASPILHCATEQTAYAIAFNGIQIYTKIFPARPTDNRIELNRQPNNTIAYMYEFERAIIHV